MGADSAKHLKRKNNMAKGFEVYQLYNATNLGFSKNSDYRTYKYDGKVRGSIDKFSESPFKFRCVAIGRLLNPLERALGMYGLAMRHGGYIPPRALTPKSIETQVKAVQNKFEDLFENGYEKVLKEIMEDTGPIPWDDLTKTNDDSSLPPLATKVMTGEVDWIIGVLVYDGQLNPFNKNTGFVAESFIDELKQHAYYLQHLVRGSQRSEMRTMHHTWLRLVNEA